MHFYKSALKKMMPQSDIGQYDPPKRDTFKYDQIGLPLLYAKFLVTAKPRLALLDEALVIELVAGKKGWKDFDGNEHRIQKPVKYSDLKNRHFVHYDLGLFSPGIIPENLKTSDDKTRELFDAVSWLIEINNKGLYNEMVLLESVAAKIYQEHLALFPQTGSLDSLEWLIPTNSNYIIKFEHNAEIKKISGAFWHIKMELENPPKEIIHDWLIWYNIAYPYSLLRIPEFYNNQEETDFFGSVLDVILEDEELKENWDVEAQKHIILNNPNGHAPVGVYPAENSFSAYRWWRDFNPSYDLQYNISKLIWMIVKAEICGNNAFPHTQRLLEAIPSHPRIGFCLFVWFSWTNTEEWQIELLSMRDTAAIALINLSDSPIELARSAFDEKENKQNEKWRESVWDTALEMFFLHFQDINQENKEEYTDHLSEILLYFFGKYAESHAHQLEHFARSRYLQEQAFLKKNEQITIRVSSKDLNRSLLQFISENLTAKFIDALNSQSGNADFALKEILLLEWLFFQQEKYSTDIEKEYSEMAMELSVRIVEAVLDYYKGFLTKKPQNTSYQSDIISIFRKINWAIFITQAQNQELINKVLDAISDDMFIKLDSDEYDKNQQAQLRIRMHLNFLILLIQDDSLDSLLKKRAEVHLIELCQLIFLKERVRKVLASDFLQIKLEIRHLAESLASMSEEVREAIIDLICESELEFIVELLDVNQVESVEKRLIETIKNKSKDPMSNISFGTLQTIAVHAANNGMIDLAKQLVDENISKNEYHRENWQWIQFQIEIENISQDQNLSADDKEREIRTIENPFKNDSMRGSPKYKEYQQYENSRRNHIAFSYLKENPEKTARYFEGICQDFPDNLKSAGLRTLAYLTWYEKNPPVNRQAAYRRILRSWEEVKNKEVNRGLIPDDIQIRNILEIYFQLEDWGNFDFQWEQLSKNQQHSEILFSAKFQQLVKQNRTAEALAFLNEVSRTHQLKFDDTSALSKKIEEYKKEAHGEARKREPFIYSDYNRITMNTTTLVDEFQGLGNLPDSELLSIVAPSSKDLGYFMLDYVLICLKTLQSRIASIKKLLTPNIEYLKSIVDSSEEINLLTELDSILKNNRKLNENTLNDLLADLLERNFSYLKFSVQRESPAGYSGEGKNPGELDIVIKKPSGETIAILEGIKYKDGNESAITETTKKDINKHLDRFRNHNLSGVDFLFLVNYCQTNDLERVRVEYENFIQETDIKGYQKSGKANLEKRRTPESFIYKQSLRKGGANVTLYHIVATIQEIAPSKKESKGAGQ